jgi:hypothetical protein
MSRFYNRYENSTDPNDIEKFNQLDIRHFINDGFRLICSPYISPSDKTKWWYDVHDADAMFGTHDSWVYFITCEGKVVKVGETGLPLGIYAKHTGRVIASTKCRFGRLANLGGTDEYIRTELKSEVRKGTVSLWAKRCDKILHECTIAGKPTQAEFCSHKQLELYYLDYLTDHAIFPALNKCRK